MFITTDFLKLGDKFSVVEAIQKTAAADSSVFILSFYLDMHALPLNNKLTIILNLSSSFKKSNMSNAGFRT